MRDKPRKHLSPTDKEVVLQTLMVLGGNKKQTAERCGVSVRTVYNCIEEAERAGRDLKQAQEIANARIAGKLAAKTEKLIDSITPEDMESGRIPLYDKDGKVAGYKYYGPSLAQKCLAVGIMTDKMRVHDEYRRAISDDVNSGRLLMPQDIAGLVAGVREKIRSLSVLQVNFEREAPDLAARAQAVIEDAEIVAATEPQREVIELDEFDNPGKTD